jgi:hypothetical protein
MIPYKITSDSSDLDTKRADEVVTPGNAGLRVMGNYGI